MAVKKFVVPHLQNVVLAIASLVYIGSISVMVYAKQNPQPTSRSVAVAASRPMLPQSTIQGQPVRIIVPSVQIDLKVEPGTYDLATDAWTLSGYNAHFATMLAPANDKAGNTFIYGHNNKDVFGPLKNLPPQSQVEIVTDNGNRFIYTHRASKTVEPTDTSLLSYSGPPILTIQTCTGVWHEKRGLYEFTLTSVIESHSSMAQRTEEQRVEMLRTISIPLTTSKIGQWL